MNNLNILVTGSKGQLGYELERLTGKENRYTYTFVDIEEMDISSEESIYRFFEGKNFNVIINCAAYTAVDKAEEESTLAYAINAKAVKTLVDICLEKKIRLIHISTDYVFDGNGNQPLTETSGTNPLSVYGKSKLQGENHVLSTLPEAYVLRTAWVYSSHGKNFVKTIAGLARQRETLSVVYDQIGSPTYARDLASVIIMIILKIGSHQPPVPGLYHYSNEGVISWYDLACFIMDYYKLPCKILPIKSEQYKTQAARPKFSVLDKSKIRDSLKIDIPHWHKSLLECLSELEK